MCLQADAVSGLLAVAHEQAELRVYQFCPQERELAVAVLGTTPGKDMKGAEHLHTLGRC